MTVVSKKKSNKRWSLPELVFWCVFLPALLWTYSLFRNLSATKENNEFASSVRRNLGRIVQCTIGLVKGRLQAHPCSIAEKTVASRCE